MNTRQKILMVVTFIALTHFFLVALFGDNGLLELHRKHMAHKAVLKDNARLTQENLKMYSAIERLQNDAAYIENVARQELGMIHTDEVIFKFKSDLKALQ